MGDGVETGEKSDVCGVLGSILNITPLTILGN